MKRRIILLLTFLIMSICIPVNVCFGEIKIDTSSPFIYPGTSTKNISMDFQEAPLVDVLKIFSQQTEFNLITAESIANKKITVYLDNVPVEKALEQVLNANNLAYELHPDSDIYIVKPLSKPDSELITRIYPLKYATVTGAKILKTIEIESSGSSGDSGGEASASGFVAAVKGVLTEKGNVVEDPRTNSIIVTDIVTNFVHIEHTIARLDIPVPLVLIELEMLDVSKQVADKIGIQYGNTPLVITGGSKTTLLPFDGVPLWNEPAPATTTITPGSMSATGLKATLQYLRTHTDTKTLARPRILTLDNETAEIKIATDEAIGSGSTSTSTGDLSTATTEAERVETGVFLTVTPQVNRLTNEITLAVVPKVTVAKTGATFGDETFKDPEERISQSILRVHSGDTIIMGGLLRTDDSSTITKLPFFGDIPVIGTLFRHRDQTVTERELIIFITPHILEENYKQQTASINSAEIIREQDLPIDRVEKIEKELSNIENQKL